MHITCVLCIYKQASICTWWHGFANTMYTRHDAACRKGVTGCSTWSICMQWSHNYVKGMYRSRIEAYAASILLQVLKAWKAPQSPNKSHLCITPPMYPHVLGHFLKTLVRYISHTDCGSGLTGWGKDRGGYSCHTKLGYSLIISHLSTG